MLARAEPPTNDFLALARYLVHGRERPIHPERVAWSFAQNLPTSDPENAAILMAATAALSKRCRSACYHVMITWAERERPTPEVMQEIALKTLGLANLGEHQALIMGHGDKPHRHLHMMINRVHPETGRAWKTSHDYARLDDIMRQLSGEHGFEYVPAHAFNPDLTEDLPKKPNSRASRAARRGPKTVRPQWSRKSSRRFAERISEKLDQASTWDDLAQLFADEGLELEAKGKGHVVGNAASYTKLSALGLQKTAKGFERQRPARPVRKSRKPGSRSILAIDGVEFARALATFGLADKSVIRNAVAEAQGQRSSRIARLPLIAQLLADLYKVFAASTAHTSPKRKKPKPNPRLKQRIRKKMQEKDREP